MITYLEVNLFESQILYFPTKREWTSVKALIDKHLGPEVIHI